MVACSVLLPQLNIDRKILEESNEPGFQGETRSSQDQERESNQGLLRLRDDSDLVNEGKNYARTMQTVGKRCQPRVFGLLKHMLIRFP